MRLIKEYEEEMGQILHAGKVVLLGAGGNFYPIVSVLTELGIEILAICDNNEKLYGSIVEVFHNKELEIISVEKAFHSIGNKAPWIIASANEVSIRNIRQQIRKIGRGGRSYIRYIGSLLWEKN